MKKLVLFDIDYTLFNTQKFKDSNLEMFHSYEEVLDVLIGLSKKVTIGIFSEGQRELQEKKLKEINVIQYFLREHVHIVESKDESMQKVLEKYKDYQIFLVDDKLPVLFAAKKILPSIKTLWIKRGYYAQKQTIIEDFKPDFETESLQGVVSFIENI